MSRRTGALVGSSISAEAKKLLDDWVADIPNLWKDLSKKAMTLVHGDVWINNICFPQQNPAILPCFGESGFAGLDWQTVCKV